MTAKQRKSLGTFVREKDREEQRMNKKNHGRIIMKNKDERTIFHLKIQLKGQGRRQRRAHVPLTVMGK